MTFELQRERHGIAYKFSGVVTSDEIERSEAEFNADPSFDELKYFIWDASDIETLSLPNELVEFFAATDAVSSISSSLKGAFVATNNEVINKVNHYINLSEKFNTNWKLKLFDSNENARNWIEYER